jgi:hypothetical protein
MWRFSPQQKHFAAFVFGFSYDMFIQHSFSCFPQGATTTCKRRGGPSLFVAAATAVSGAASTSASAFIPASAFVPASAAPAASTDFSPIDGRVRLNFLLVFRLSGMA